MPRSASRSPALMRSRIVTRSPRAETVAGSAVALITGSAVAPWPRATPAGSARSSAAASSQTARRLRASEEEVAIGAKVLRAATARAGRAGLEHDGAVAVEQHAVLEVPAHRAGEHRALDVAPDPLERADVVVSNHDDARRDVESFGVPYVHVPNSAAMRRGAEEAMLERLAGRFDLIVLARYMQILSGSFLSRVGAPVINIHHSFLPAFAGAGPYQRARERGVKIIGATAHYVTEELDAGPIIEQDVERVTHAEDVPALQRIGRDIERTVLARAVRWHLEDRVLLDGNRTVVF